MCAILQLVSAPLNPIYIYNFDVKPVNTAYLCADREGRKSSKPNET